MVAVNLSRWWYFFLLWFPLFFILALIQVHGEWLVYANQLVLFPAVVLTSTGSVIVRGATIEIPVECRYKR